MLTEIIVLCVAISPPAGSPAVRPSSAVDATVAAPEPPPAANVGAAASSAEPAPPLEGIWPSQKLMKSLVYRWADAVVEEYELDDQQRAEVREAAAGRWGQFLQENRSKIQPLVNEFIEMRADVVAPSEESVQAWAGRALPVLEKLREQVTLGMEDFRKPLNPLQRANFDRQAIEIGLELQIAQNKLKQWHTGDFEVDEFWDRPQASDPARREELQRQRTAEVRRKLEERERRAETDQIALELTVWDKYVEEFIQTRKLDEGQRTAALSCLSELKARARAHRNVRRDDIARLEGQVRSNTGKDEELAKIKKQLIELYGPIDEMFKELARRIEAIPTTVQQNRVEPQKKGD